MGAAIGIAAGHYFDPDDKPQPNKKKEKSTKEAPYVSQDKDPTLNGTPYVLPEMTPLESEEYN